MSETDFYTEVSEKFKKYLLDYLPDNSRIEFACHKTLPKMIVEIEAKFGCQSPLSGKYVPGLQLDILFGVQIPDKEIYFILFEVKHLKNLPLASFSQLVGYLQVAKVINIGLLLLVIKEPTANMLSTDFADIILMKKLPMKWSLILDEVLDTQQHKFETGICTYVPNNGIEWKDTSELGGIISFEDLATKLISMNSRL
jgi:hypothetical protein